MHLKRCLRSAGTIESTRCAPANGVRAGTMMLSSAATSRRPARASYRLSCNISRISYRFDGMGKAARIIAVAIAHHRFNYIHPFPDGNGRVSRLMSHAMGHAAGIGAYGLWSVSRGLARGLENPAEYKMMMDMADAPRENDFDGRGNLSRRALSEFVLWFLRVCLDQVRFMTELFELDTLARRLRVVAERDDRLRPEAGKLLEAAAIRGEIERGEASRITGLSERTARRVLNETIAAGFLASETPKGPVYVEFPPATAEALFPRLFLAE